MREDFFFTTQRSWFICIPIHSSGVVLNIFDRRMDISGLTPDLPLTSSDMALRVTPAASARAVIVMPIGSTHNSFNTLPG
jgi:hypothetical protein